MTSKLIEFEVYGDERGSLIAFEENHNVPFDIKRIYYIFGTKEGVRRGLHAHKNLKQIAISISGSCSFILDDGITKESLILESRCRGLYIEGLIWHEMYDFSPDCVLMVIANDYYDENDYIRDYKDFLEAVDNANN